MDEKKSMTSNKISFYVNFSVNGHKNAAKAAQNIKRGAINEVKREKNIELIA